MKKKNELRYFLQLYSIFFSTYYSNHKKLVVKSHPVLELPLACCSGHGQELHNSYYAKKELM